jgi:hypothetical protein
MDLEEGGTATAFEGGNAVAGANCAIIFGDTIASKIIRIDRRVAP